MENVSNLGRWTNLIYNVRSRYSGPLTYSASWSTAGTGPAGNVTGGYSTVPFWSQLDYAGIDAYFNLTNSNSPTQTQLDSAWTNIANTIESWRANPANGAANKQLLFTEVGYACLMTARIARPIPDQEARRLIPTSKPWVRALMSRNVATSSWDGAFWWNRTTVPRRRHSDKDSRRRTSQPSRCWQYICDAVI